MAKTRAFSPEGLPEKKADYHGSARFARASPDVAQQGIKSLNLDIPFEEALKLSLALNSCLQSLNRYHRGTTKGRAMGVCLSVKMDNSFISVIETTIRSPEKPDAA
jgi:hypothetical protein